VLALTVVIAAFSASVPSAYAYLYWTDNGPGVSSTGTTIGRASLDGSGVVGSLVATSPGPGGIVSDASHVYWVNDNAGVFSIGRANLDGSGADPTFISGAATSGGAFAVTTDGTYLYWTDGSRYVGRAGLDGAGAVGHFIDMGSGRAPFGIAVYGGVLYVGEVAQIVRVSASGGSPTVFTPISGQAAVSLAAAGGYVYWTENLLGSPSPNGVVGRALVTGSGVTESYLSGLQDPTGIATDGNKLYWVDHGTGTIGRATIGSGGPSNIQPTFISDSGGPLAVALDSAIDPTRTSVTCNPPSLAVGSVTACTALVSDSASTSIPAGSVVFSATGSRYFSGGNSCTLTPRPGGGASCTVAAASSTTGTQGLTAAYSGDLVHAPKQHYRSILRRDCHGVRGDDGHQRDDRQWDHRRRHRRQATRVQGPKAQGQDTRELAKTVGSGPLPARKSRQAPRAKERQARPAGGRVPGAARESVACQWREGWGTAGRAAQVREEIALGRPGRRSRRPPLALIRSVMPPAEAL
jgi:hypothetical protein